MLNDVCNAGVLQAVWPDLAIYWTLGKFLKPLPAINLPKSPPFLGNFCKGVKIYYFSSEIILGNFYRHLAIFSGHTGYIDAMTSPALKMFRWNTSYGLMSHERAWSNLRQRFKMKTNLQLFQSTSFWKNAAAHFGGKKITCRRLQIFLR